MNPYGKHLGKRDVLEVLAGTSEKIGALAKRIDTEEVSNSKNKEPWSAREIIQHLVHSEINYAVRLRNSLTQQDFVVQPFDQNLWLEREADFSLSEIVTVFRVLRKFNLQLILDLSAKEKKRIFLHPELGELNIETLLEMMAGHDLSHLNQLKGSAGMLAALRRV